MRRALCIALAVGCGLAPRAARAFESEIEAQTISQGYQLRGPTGDPILSRRRVTQVLGIGLYKLTGADESSQNGELFFRARVRLDGDFGMESDEYRIARDPNFQRYVPGLQPAPFDLMFGYLEGRRFLHGMLGFKLGRQYVIDPLGYYAFDGALVRITTPAYFAIEVYGGAEVRGGLPLSSGRWEMGGIQRGDRSDFPLNRYPSFQNAGVAPTYAIAIETAGPTWVHGRFTYRKAYNTGQSFVSTGGALLGPDAIGIYDTRRVSSERIGWGGDLDLWSIASLRGKLAYDLYGRNWNEIAGGADFFLGQKVTVGADYEYFRPIFDADSIFNAFGIEPMDDVSARVEVTPNDRLDLEADAMVRRYRSNQCTKVISATINDVACDATDLRTRLASSFAPGGGLRARYRWSVARATIRSSVLSGDQGNRFGGDAIYERSIAKKWLADARLSLWHFDDKLRTGPTGLYGQSRTATSLGYVLGVGYQLAPEANAFLQFEHDMNRLVGQRFRLMAVLNVRAWL